MSLIKRFVRGLFEPPAWVRQAESLIAIVVRRRQELIEKLESVVQ